LIRHPTPELIHSGSAPVVSAGRVSSSSPFAADLGDVGPGSEVLASWTVVLRQHGRANDEGYEHVVAITSDGLEPLEIDATVRPGDRPSPGELRAASNGSISVALTVNSPSGVPVESGDPLRLNLQLVAGADGLRNVEVRTLAGTAVDPHEGSVCLTCHERGDSCDEATERMYETLVGLERDVRDAAESLHRAELAGMDVGAARFQLNSDAKTALIESRALVHSFEPDRLIERSGEGRAVAKGALEAGTAALAEIDFRRKGLAVSLILILMVALGLYLRIRQVDRERGA
jgi:hypothetical protein